jgi:hypothetical protein
MPAQDAQSVRPSWMPWKTSAAPSSPSPSTMKSIGACCIDQSGRPAKCSPPQTIGSSGNRARISWRISRTIGHENDHMFVTPIASVSASMRSTISSGVRPSAEICGLGPGVTWSGARPTASMTDTSWPA